MKTPLSLLPDLPTLTRRLNAALDGQNGTGPVQVLRRQRPRFMSTFPNEILTCSFPGGRKRRVFVKYGAGRGHHGFGHRGNVPYEAQVYQRLLQSQPDFRPKCLGAHTDSRTGDTALFLEYAGRCAPLSWNDSACQPRPMLQLARWLARFHARHQTGVGQSSLSFLKRYDAPYYRGWAQRTFEFARPLQPRFPWLSRLRRSGDAWFAPLLSAAPTVIHGEFFPKTVLLRGKSLFVLDWESAAIAPGEIDLAMLTDGPGWPAGLVQRCKDSYQRTRWPDGARARFNQTLAAAEVYAQFRWLGDRPEKTLKAKQLWRFEHLRAATKRLGVL